MHSTMRTAFMGKEGVITHRQVTCCMLLGCKICRGGSPSCLPQHSSTLHAGFHLCVFLLEGRRYRDDPAIFGWDLINEPRCNCFPSKLPPSSEWEHLEGSCSPKCADKITVRAISPVSAVNFSCVLRRLAPLCRTCKFLGKQTDTCSLLLLHSSLQCFTCSLPT